LFSKDDLVEINKRYQTNPERLNGIEEVYYFWSILDEIQRTDKTDVIVSGKGSLINLIGFGMGSTSPSLTLHLTLLPLSKDDIKSIIKDKDFPPIGKDWISYLKSENTFFEKYCEMVYDLTLGLPLYVKKAFIITHRQFQLNKELKSYLTKEILKEELMKDPNVIYNIETVISMIQVLKTTELINFWGDVAKSVKSEEEKGKLVKKDKIYTYKGREVTFNALINRIGLQYSEVGDEIKVFIAPIVSEKLCKALSTTIGIIGAISQGFMFKDKFCLALLTILYNRNNIDDYFPYLKPFNLENVTINIAMESIAKVHNVQKKNKNDENAQNDQNDENDQNDLNDENAQNDLNDLNDQNVQNAKKAAKKVAKKVAKVEKYKKEKKKKKMMKMLKMIKVISMMKMI